MMFRLFKRQKTQVDEEELRPDDPLGRICNAVDELNEAWNELKTHENKSLRGVRPWILWDEKRVIITRYRSKPEVVYDPIDGTYEPD